MDTYCLGNDTFRDEAERHKIMMRQNDPIWQLSSTKYYLIIVSLSFYNSILRQSSQASPSLANFYIICDIVTFHCSHIFYCKEQFLF